MQATGFFEDLVNSGLDGLLLGDIGLDGKDLAGVLLGDGGELVACFSNVDGINSCGAVGETAVCYPESDT